MSLNDKFSNPENSVVKLRPKEESDRLWDEFMKKSKICEEKGHKYNKKSEVGVNGLYKWGECKRCKMMYKRPYTSEESKKHAEFMRTPFNI